MFIHERFYDYNANNIMGMNMSLEARGHSYWSRDFKKVLLSIIVPRPFLYDDLNFLEGHYGNTPSPIYRNIPLPPTPVDFQLLSTTNKKIQIRCVFSTFSKEKNKKKQLKSTITIGDFVKWFFYI